MLDYIIKNIKDIKEVQRGYTFYFNGSYFTLRKCYKNYSLANPLNSKIFNNETKYSINQAKVLYDYLEYLYYKH